MNLFKKLTYFIKKRRGDSLNTALNELLSVSGSSKDDYDINLVFEKISSRLRHIAVGTIFSVINQTKNYIVFRHVGLMEQCVIARKIKKISLEDLPYYQRVMSQKSSIFLRASHVSTVAKLTEAGNLIYPNSLANNDSSADDSKVLKSAKSSCGGVNSIIAPLIIKNEIIGFLEFFSNDLRASQLADVDKFVKELTNDIAHIILFHEVKQSEERYRDLFENSKEGFFILSGRKRQFLEVNHGLCELTGYSKEELAQLNYLLLFDCHERGKVKDYIAKHHDSYQAANISLPVCETKIVAKTAVIKYVELKITRANQHGEYFCIVYDRTEKVLAERVAEENARMYHQLVESANSIIVRRKLSGRITFANSFALKFFGYDKKELIGKKLIGTILPPVDSAGRDSSAMVRDIGLHPENYANNICENMRKDGSRVWIAWTVKPLLDEKGKVAEILSVGNDITSRKMAEELLYQSEENYKKLSEFNKKILDTAPYSIITIDKNGILTYVNKHFYNFSGSTSPLNRNVFILPFFINEGLCEPLKKLLIDGTPFSKDNCRTVNSKGEAKYLNVIHVPLRDADGKINGALSMAVDNTEAMRAKMELERLNQALENKVAERTEELNLINKRLSEALELKTKFIADASHELRTPLTIIQGNFDLIKRQISGQRQDVDEHLDAINKELRHISNILSDLFILSNADEHQNLTFDKIDLAELIEACCNSIKVLADEKNIRLKKREISSSLEVLGNEDKLEKLFLNILRNAVRYNKDNGWIEIWAENDSRQVKIHIADSGLGIPAEDLPYIFERFYRVDKARSRSDGGTGLGLAICKCIARDHQGEITVQSKLGQGSVFTIHLPVDFKSLGR